MYGSSLIIVTRRPRHLSKRPSDEAVSPLPSDEDTPPVTKTYLVKLGASRASSYGRLRAQSTGGASRRGRSCPAGPGGFPGRGLGLGLQELLGMAPCRRGVGA